MLIAGGMDNDFIIVGGMMDGNTKGTIILEVPNILDRNSLHRRFPLALLPSPLPPSDVLWLVARSHGQEPHGRH